MRQIVTALGVIAILVASIACLRYGLVNWTERGQVNRVLDADPDELLNACRDILRHRDQFEPMVNHRFGHYAAIQRDNISKAPLPMIIKALHPRSICFSSNSVSVDVTNPFNPFGFTGFAEGATETGKFNQVKWRDGLWLFHDGQLSGEKANKTLNRIF